MSRPHCTPDELLDVAEGTRAAHSLPHLAQCPHCQRQLDELRVAVAEIADVPVPEPPAAFWDELTQRVHVAVAQEPPPRARGWFGTAAWPEWRHLGQVWPAAATLAAVLLLAVVLVPRNAGRIAVQETGTADIAGGHATVSATASGEGSASAAADAPRQLADSDIAGLPVAEEAAFLAFMGDLADGLDLENEAAGSHGLLPSGATTEAAVADLSGEERVELQRLLQDALSGAGV